MKRRNLYIIAWASGHQPPRTVFFRITDTGWCGTYDRELATRFKTVKLAREAWDSKHIWPLDFSRDWQSGCLRIEPAAAPMLPFCRENESEGQR